MVIRKGHGDINLILRERDVIACLECPVGGLCLCLKLPFLKESGEGPDIDHLLRIVIRDRYLTVSVQEFLCQTASSARPFLLSLHILKIDMLFVVVSSEDIVKTQSCVLEVGGEGLRR